MACSAAMHLMKGIALVFALSTCLSCATATNAGPDSSVSSTGDGGSADAASSDGSLADAQPPAIDAGPAPDAANTTCQAPVDISAGGTFAGQSTVGATDKLSPPSGNGCPAGGLNSGPDIIYVVSPPSDTLYEITVTPGNGSFDPMLYAMTSCDFDTGCSAGTILNGPGSSEQITFTAGSQDVYVVVDGESNSSGPFTMEVVATAL